MIILSIIVFIAILGVLVFVHELGHFIVAKKSGMQVMEFAFGFGPRLFSIKRGETNYAVNILPFGGYVKIAGENNEDEANPRSFINMGFWPRMATLVAGVAMNAALGWILLSIGMAIGLPIVLTQGDKLPAGAMLRSESVAVLEVAARSPAAKAGIKEGDQIISVDSRKLSDYSKITEYARTRAGNELDLEIKRGSQILRLRVLARAHPPADEGPMGVALANVGLISFPWYAAPVQGFKAAYHVWASTMIGFWSLVSSGAGLEHVGGPIRIAALTNQVTKLGLVYVIQFAAFLSINLAFINIIPFPALDGGRVLFLLIEKIRGKRNNQKIEQIANTIGFALLIILIVFISAKDIKSLIS